MEQRVRTTFYAILIMIENTFRFSLTQNRRYASTFHCCCKAVVKECSGGMMISRQRICKHRKVHFSEITSMHPAIS